MWKRNVEGQNLQRDFEPRCKAKRQLREFLQNNPEVWQFDPTFPANHLRTESITQQSVGTAKSCGDLRSLSQVYLLLLDLDIIRLKGYPCIRIS